ncbi:SDR family NAD(P)-dependent oxidoreductase [Alicyclobacillus sp. ALC3]|uniref:SDR family NAD(P)-dependent oxidoreductase n=1 Tax=Alicyclobacillus sp. ALC3 TaxID=2796143 RepID=UPI00237989CC|nr:SDR family NAD(P)-dependent oxidoreductase [Alicyclobacillus sp. ALC3]WDL95338.1 SDR family oxidoreductase [Alicyclobacillus sp. ALC3]
MGLLDGKIAVVTGAASGIGRSIATHYAGEGATVVVADLNVEAAEGVAAQLRQTAPESMAVQVNVTSKVSCQALYETVYQRYGRIDIVGNNAGVSTMNRIVDLTEEEWDFNMNVNAKGVFLCTQAALPYLIEQGGGRIINTASMAGKRGTPLLAHYAASKWAVIGFTKSTALEVAEHGITVNCVCPGFVKTSMQDREIVWEGQLRGMDPADVYDEYIRLTPMKRIQTPDDVARIYVFLASHLADFVTGEAVDVTGGADLV